MKNDTNFESILMDQLLRHEGYRRFPYKCTSGRETIGIGRNISDKGISKSEALHLLRNDINECHIDLSKLFLNSFNQMPLNAQLVLLDLRFNLGARGFRSFKNMIRNVEHGNWEGAAAEMIKSRWFNQTGTRAITLVNMMRSIKSTPEQYTECLTDKLREQDIDAGLMTAAGERHYD